MRGVVQPRKVDAGRAGEDRITPTLAVTREDVAAPVSHPPLPEVPPGSPGGLARVVTGTLLGALVPGAGLLVAGRRAAGASTMIVLACVLGAGASYAALRRPSPRDLVAWAVDPGALTLTAAALVLVGGALVGLLVVSHVQLRRGVPLDRGRGTLASLVLLVACLLVALPLGTAGRYVLIQRDLLTTVFRPAARLPPPVDQGGEEPDPWAGAARINVLLIGSDAGPDRVGVRPDSMILASVNTTSGDTVLFSIPRNLVRAPFPRGSQGARAWPRGFGPAGSCGPNASLCWLNAVWTTAMGPEARQHFPGDPHPGLTATRQAVEGITGLRVDHHVLVDLQGFADVVDALGGLTLNVRTEDPRGLPIGGTSEYPVAQGWIRPGEHRHLDGYHALWFARSRWSTNDYDRMRRQRCVVAGILAQGDPVSLAQGFPGLAASLKDNLSTDVPLSRLSDWVDLTLKVKQARVRSLPLSPALYGSWADPDYERIRQLVRTSLDPPPVPAPVRGGGRGAREGNVPPSGAPQVQDTAHVC